MSKPLLKWSKVRAGVYSAASPWGLYTIDGNNYGRNRWTVTYPDSDYALADALAEAKAWAEMDYEERARRSTVDKPSNQRGPLSHAAKPSMQALRKKALAFSREASELLWYEHPDVGDGGCADVSGLIVEAGQQVGLDMRVVYGWARPNSAAPTPHAWLDVYGKRFDPTWPLQEIRGSAYREDPHVEGQLKPEFCEVGLTRKIWMQLLNEILTDPKIRWLTAQLNGAV